MEYKMIKFFVWLVILNLETTHIFNSPVEFWWILEIVIILLAANMADITIKDFRK